MGSGTWTVTGASVVTTWNIGGTNLTFNKNTANIVASNTGTSSRTFTGGDLSYNKLTIAGATGISTLRIAGSNSFTELASTKPVAHTIEFSADQGTIQKWTVTGTSGNVVTVKSQTAGTQRIINLTEATTAIDYMSVQDIVVNQANRFYVGANSTDGGNNLNVIFTANPMQGSGNMFMMFYG